VVLFRSNLLRAIGSRSSKSRANHPNGNDSSWFAHKQLSVNKTLGLRYSRKSHNCILLDPPQGELGDAPLQRNISELRLGRVR